MNFDLVPGTEYFLTVSASLKEDDGLVPAGTVLTAEQFELPIYQAAPNKQERLPALQIDDQVAIINIQSDGFSVSFDKTKGQLTSYKLGEKEMLMSGPEPVLWRAPIDNDFGNDMPVRSRMWREFDQMTGWSCPHESYQDRKTVLCRRYRARWPTILCYVPQENGNKTECPLDGV